ncbi:unnamed protein product, partial [Vitis vinifera]
MHTHPKSLVSTNFWKQQILPLYTKRALKKRMKQLLSPTLLLLILFLLCTTTYDLKTGTLNSYTDEQKAALTKFHVLHSFLTISQFQTVSNPLHTEAAANTEEFPLNVIGNGTQVNITTGLVNTTVDSTVYSDGQLAVYEISQVLLAQGILRPQAPAPAPLPAKPKKATPLNSHAPSTSTTVSVDSSGATGTLHYAPLVVSIGVASPASAPAPSGPPDITALLRKAGKYTTFIGLLKSTQMDVQINSELQKKSDPGFTIFAPTDTAFSNLKPGTLNSFTDQQKAALTQFHVVPSYLSNSQFQTVSNPLRTEAGGDTVEFPLNITTNGTQVSMTTGLVNTTVDDTVYIDGQLAVYEIGEVLLAQGILRPPAPPPLPPKNASPSSNAPSGSISSSGDFSDATCLRYAPTAISYGVAILEKWHKNKAFFIFRGKNIFEITFMIHQIQYFDSLIFQLIF